MIERRADRGRHGRAIGTSHVLGVAALAVALAASCGRNSMPGAADGGAAGATGMISGGRGGGAGAAGATAGAGGSGGAAQACGGRTTANPPVCGAALCGNGTRDTCAGGGGIGGYSTGGGGVGGGGYAGEGGYGPSHYTEECDGTDLPQTDCRTFGYASGTVGCSANCTYDLSGCEECGASQPSVRFCGRLSIAAFDPGSLALAATDAEIGLAWAGTDAAGVMGLHFTRLSPDLAVLSSASVQSDSEFYGWGEVSVAPLPSGWVIAASGRDSLTLYPIAADGHLVGKTMVPTPRSPLKPLLAARPGAGPVLVWIVDYTNSGLRAAVVADDGLSIATPIVLPLDGEPNEHEVDAAFVAGAVHVVAPVDLGTVRPLRIVRILPDGSGASLVGGPSGRFLRLPAFVAGAANLDMVFQDGDTTTLTWQRYDGTGSAIASVDLGSFALLDYVASVASGDAAAVLVPERGEPKLTLMEVQGASLRPGFTVAYANPFEPRLARRGAELIAAWVGWGGGCASSRISIARLTP
jgi:hypothetical protein